MKILFEIIFPKSRKSKKSRFELSCFHRSGSVFLLKQTIALEIAKAFMIKNVPGPELKEPMNIKAMEPKVR